jgi:hypothetical protein
MPDAKNSVKMTGDTHLPDVESDLPVEQARPGRGIKKAGVLKDKDDEGSDSYGNPRDSGSASDEDRG